LLSLLENLKNDSTTKFLTTRELFMIEVSVQDDFSIVAILTQLRLFAGSGTHKQEVAIYAGK